MLPNSELSVRRSGTGRRVSVKGVLDETFDPQPLFAETGSTFVYDLSGVERVTSFGVREWIRALSRLHDRAHYFIEVPPVLVAQFNMVAGFGGNGRIISLQAPYICNACEHEQTVTIEASAVSELLVEPESPPCPECGGVDVELDDIPEVYFDFVANQPTVTLSPLVRRLIRGDMKEPSTYRPLTLRKEVAGEDTLLMLSGSIDESPRYGRLFDGLEGTVVIMCGAVSVATEEGARLFVDALGRSRTPTYLARVPRVLMHRLATMELRAHNVHVASCVLSLQDSERTPLYWDFGPGSPAPEIPELQHDVTVARQLIDQELPERIQELVNADGSATPSNPTTSIITSGRTVLDRYVIVRQVARGGMGEVFIARQRSGLRFAREVIVKRLRPEHTDSGHMVDMFLREARLASMISHPNVVTVLDFGKERDGYYLAMEYIHGWDLATILRALRSEGRIFPEPLACRLVSQVCAGLSAAHSARDGKGQTCEIVHRDISPSNILVMESGEAKITDFGIAKITAPADHTETGIVKGKPAYMAPEQLDHGHVDRRADIFAAGVVLLECLTLQRPFSGGGRRSTSAAMIALNARRQETSERLQGIVRRALQESPEDRYESARAMEEDLELCIADGGEVVTSSALAHFLSSLTLPLPGQTEPNLVSRIGATRTASGEINR